MRYRTAVAALLAMLTVTPAHADEAIWSALKDGGKVVLMRHAAVDRSSGNPTLHTSGDCSKELNLSKLGREQAKRIGEMFRARGIFTGDVLASPYCRTMDTGATRLRQREALRGAAPDRRHRRTGSRTHQCTGDETHRWLQGQGESGFDHAPAECRSHCTRKRRTRGHAGAVPKGGEEFDVLGKLSAPRD